MRRIKQIEVKAGQSVFDIALQEYGNIEAMPLVLEANPNLNATSTLTPGQLLTIWTDAAISVVNEVVANPALYAQLQQIMAEWIITFNQTLDRYVTSISTAAQSAGTLPTVTNENGILQLVLTRNNGLHPLTLNLGSITAKSFWLGTMAEYEAIETPDENTIYHIEEDPA